MTSRPLPAFIAAVMLVFTTGYLHAGEPAEVKAFHGAVREGNVARVRTMLGKDGSLAVSVDEYRFRPVHLMDMYFETEILDLLLANGADINARNDEGVTILHIVTDEKAVPIMIAKGADREARDKRGWTPLIAQAGERDSEEILAALLRAGADPNAKGNRGETALSFARERQELRKVRLLERAGARE